MLAKFKLNSRAALISKALIGSNNSHDEFVLIKEYDNINKSVHQRNCLFLKECYRIAWSVEKCWKYKSKSCKDKKRKNNAFTKMRSVW